MIRKKVVMIGDFGVGKTSLIRRYVDNAFDDSYLATIGVKISRKALHLEDMECELLIWDTEGSSPIKGLPYSYFKGASGAIFVCDVTREETVNHLNEHINTFLMLNNAAKHVLAYNKADLLPFHQQETLRQSLPGNAFLTSAKEDVDVDLLFSILAKEMLL